MEIFDIDKLSLFLVFFAPGFISIKVYGLMVPSDKKDWNQVLLDGISYSSINFALTSWLIALISKPEFRKDYAVWYYVLLLVVLFVLPVIWPILLRLLLNSRFLLGRTLTEHPTAWDGYFSKAEPCWVLIHLKNGALIGGLFAEGSVASAFPSDHDICLSEVWRVDEIGRFREKIPQTGGMWIGKDAFDYLEFFKIRPEVDVHGSQSS